MGKNLRRRFYILVIGCSILYLFINNLSQPNIKGRWNLYTGSDINSELNIAEKLNSKDYMDISETSINEYRSNGKDGASTYEIKGDKLYSGDAIFTFKISNIEGEIVMYLTLVGYNFGHGEDKYVDDGETYIYVFDKEMDRDNL
ncbi:hypothetical protein [Clostridium sp.]|uniref:hypothetical protein n=1 Tax=Clostridium sp. TaxID=1506 RepID=UPI0025BE7FF1|nr:hypothetical protein [Clostridium sp.]